MNEYLPFVKERFVAGFSFSPPKSWLGSKVSEFLSFRFTQSFIHKKITEEFSLAWRQEYIKSSLSFSLAKVTKLCSRKFFCCFWCQLWGFWGFFSPMKYPLHALPNFNSHSKLTNFVTNTPDSFFPSNYFS